MEEQPVRPDLKQIVYECRDLFSRLSERNRALSEEWDDFATKLEVRADTPARREERGVFPQSAASLPQAKEFGDSLLSLHERFFETCRELLQTRLESDALRKERASLQAELARFSEKVILLGRNQADLAEQKAAYETQLKASKQILEETDRSFHRMEGQLAEKRSELESLATSLDRMAHERDAAQSARFMLESRISEIELSRAGLGDRVQSLEQRQEELRQQVGLLEDQLSRAQRRAEELEQEAVRSRERTAELEHHLTISRGRAAELDHTLEQVRQTTAPVEEFLSLKRGLLQVQEERVVQAQQEAYQIETIARLEKETQDLRARVQEAEAACSRAETVRNEAQEELRNAQRAAADLEQELVRLREAQTRIQSGPEASGPVHVEASIAPPSEPVGESPIVRQVSVAGTAEPATAEPEPFDPKDIGPSDESLPFADFAVAACPPTGSREGAVAAADEPEPLPLSIEASLFGYGEEPPVLDSLAFEEDDRVFAELTRAPDSTTEVEGGEPTAGSALEDALSEFARGQETESHGASHPEEAEPGELLSIQEVLSDEDSLPPVSALEGSRTESSASEAAADQEVPPALLPIEPPTLESDSAGGVLGQAAVERDAAGPLFPDENQPAEISPEGELTAAEVLERALAREAIEPVGEQVSSGSESIADVVLRALEGEEPRQEMEPLQESATDAEPEAELEPADPLIPSPDEGPVQPSPPPGEDPLIPPAPFQPAMDFPYPEITGVRMDQFCGKRVLLVGGDERFQSDYSHLFSMVHADLLYFPSILQLEKQGMKRHMRECDLAVVFGRAVNEPGALRMKQVAEEYTRKVFEHPSSGLVSLYHRLQRVNDEI